MHDADFENICRDSHCCCGDVVQREIKKIQMRERKRPFNQMTTQHMESK